MSHQVGQSPPGIRERILPGAVVSRCLTRLINHRPVGGGNDAQGVGWVGVSLGGQTPLRGGGWTGVSLG